MRSTAPGLRIPPGPAREWRETRKRLRWSGLRAWAALLGTLALGPASGVLLHLEATSPNPAVQRTAATFATFTAAAFVLWTLVLALPVFRLHRRRRRALGKPWRPWQFEHLTASGRDWIALLQRDGSIAGVLALRTRPGTNDALLRTRTGLLWFAGDPARAGVLSRPGGADLCYAHRPRFRTPPAFHLPPPTDPDDYPTDRFVLPYRHDAEEEWSLAAPAPVSRRAGGARRAARSR